MDYVQYIGNGRIKIKCRNLKLRRALVDLGASHSPPYITGYMHFRYEDKRDLANLLSEICALGIPLLGAGSSWPPSHIFEELKDLGLLNCEHKEIVWNGPKQPTVVQK